MIAGHFGFAAIAKSRVPEAPLWILMLATVWLDIIFVPLLLAGVESVAPADGLRAGYANLVIHADYTHSIVGAVALSGLLGAFAASRWGRIVGMLTGAVSFSHWVLDLLVHRADLPILPGNFGNLPRLGFGLWRFPVTSALVELFLVGLGAYAYWAAATAACKGAGQPTDRATVAAIAILAMGILVLALDVTGIAG